MAINLLFLAVYKFVHGPWKAQVGQTYGLASSLHTLHRQMVDLPQLGHGKETADSDGSMGLWHHEHCGSVSCPLIIFKVTGQQFKRMRL
uniref:Uncharacterized protein n=1 Tax=uncultured crenarchaeote TaxID=29281 RepID=H5SNT0_9CREN|nr:hypothetical protein HGMM_F52D10C46 [uncultured crenarchaeote]